MWANNLTPLLADEPCRFTTDLTIDLAPTGMGLDEHNSERGFDVWPMPASGELQVDLPAGSGGELVLRTMSGAVAKVLRVQPLRGRQVMDLAGLADGTYILSLVTDAGVEERSKVVVLH